MNFDCLLVAFFLDFVLCEGSEPHVGAHFALNVFELILELFADLLFILVLDVDHVELA